MSIPPRVIIGTQGGVVGARRAVLGAEELERWLRLNDPRVAVTDAMCSQYGIRGEARLWLMISALVDKLQLMQAAAERNGVTWFALGKGAKSDSELIRIDPAELERLREAAAYASFARPILEKLGDKNPLAEI